jgi:DNA repair exonuclease SbcCD ATPase subunit
MGTEPLKVIKLRVNNVMAIRAVEIEPNGAPVVTVTGRNAQGKTSLLQSIALALGGKRGAVEQALRDGEKKGEIFLDLGAYQIRRSFTQKGTYLTVTADGTEIDGGPQEFLDRLTGVFFQPFEFIRAPGRKQADLLRRISGLDFAALDRERAKVYTERRDVNRDADRLKKHAASLPVYGDAPDEPVDLGELVAELDAVRAENAHNADLRREAESAAQTLEFSQERHAELKLKLLEAEMAMKQAHVANSEAQASLIGIEDADEAPIRQRMQDVGETNRKVNANKAAEKAVGAAEEAAKQALKLTARLGEIDAEKAEALAASKLPVKDLSFTDDGVTYQGVPFSQASQAQQIKVSCALAFADRPTIRIITVPDASLLDDESLGTMRKIADAYGAQIFEEMVRTDDPAAIRIEDGVVVE